MENSKDIKYMENQYDLLRIISAFAVVLLHISVIWVDAFFSDSRFGEVYTKNFNYTCLMHVATRFAVPCFVMLAGAFSLGNEKNEEYSNYYKKRVKSILVPMCFFSLFYVLYRVAVSFGEEDFATIKTIIKSAIMGDSYYHLWYLYMVFWLYLIVPIIIRFKKSISSSQYLKVAIIFGVLACASNMTSTHKMKWDIGYAFLFLGYFFIGDIIRSRKETNPLKGTIVIVVGFATLMVDGILFYYTQVKCIDFDLCAPLSPLIMIASVLIFYGFSLFRIKMNLRKLGILSFGIYLWHPFVIGILYQTKVINASIDNRIAIPIYSIIVFIISIGLAKITNMVKKKVNILN